ncbi:hypothetical protein JTE90_005830 [Oedothorax gibbosus]|uniref:Gustatory receptor n=1 Tax=Oedothorax gibbosus TaxID=931172 RepID=A0AAV6V4G4_9ARAC|nr:hypothetical protein JTE90_005830 [Oedothorax gibbosus]
MKDNRKYLYFVAIWFLSYAAIVIPLGIIDYEIYLTSGVPYYHYGIPRENDLLYSAAAAVHTVFFFFFAQVPMITVDLFYILICHHLRCIIKKFSASLSSETSDFEALLLSYGKIKSTINFVDDQLSVFALLNVIMTSGRMYYLISSLLHINLAMFSNDLFKILIIFFYTLAEYITVITAASSVSEASAEVCQKTQVLKLNKSKAFEQMKFQSCAESEIYLTVGKLVQIRRSLTLSTVSAVLTYVVLFDNLRNEVSHNNSHSE